MRSIDLFSCIGCHAIGFERAGIETVSFCESNEARQRELGRSHRTRNHVLTPGAKMTRREEMLALADLRAANVARQKEWDVFGQLTLAYRGNELAGEVGEACNVIKKLERERLGINGSRDTTAHLAEELADVIICTDLIAMQAGIDLGSAVVAKFNASSEKVGLRTRLSAQAEPGYVADNGILNAAKFVASQDREMLAQMLFALHERHDSPSPIRFNCNWKQLKSLNRASFYKCADSIRSSISALPAPATASPGEEVTEEDLADFLYDNGFIVVADDEEEGAARALLSTYKITKRSAT